MPLVLSFTMPLPVKIILIVLAVVVVILAVLVIIGQKMQKKQQASQADIEAAAQVVSMLVIDKKRLRLKDANLPKMVTDQVPKYMRAAKMPFVKAKIGPRVMTLIADAKIYDAIPIKTEIKAKISGMYITEIISSRGKVDPLPKKKSFRARLAQKAYDAQNAGKATDTKKKK